MFHGTDGEKIVNYTLNVWNIRPRSIYQNLALELIQNEAIDLVTIQSEAGYGKTFLALASALNQVLEKKLFEKIYIVKPTIEVGAKLGFLPGDISEKKWPPTYSISFISWKNCTAFVRQTRSSWRTTPSGSV